MATTSETDQLIWPPCSREQTVPRRACRSSIPSFASVWGHVATQSSSVTVSATHGRPYPASAPTCHTRTRHRSRCRCRCRRNAGRCLRSLGKRISRRPSRGGKHGADRSEPRVPLRSTRGYSLLAPAGRIGRLRANPSPASGPVVCGAEPLPAGGAVDCGVNPRLRYGLVRPS